MERRGLHLTEAAGEDRDSTGLLARVISGGQARILQRIDRGLATGSITARLPSGEYCLTVEDAGPGFPATLVAELTEGGMDSKVLAVLAVLTAVNGAIRLLGAGTAGIETIFFLLIIAGRVYGAGFGFVLGCTSLFASALLSSGVGPWLPFQMMCAAWIGMGAGLLPSRLRGRAEIAVLVLYGVVAAYLYGFLMNLSSWPFTLGIASPGAGDTAQMVPGDPVLENLHRFVVYTLLTSTWGWDTGRAITTALCLVVLGPALLTTLRRALRRVQHVATTTPSLTS